MKPYILYLLTYVVHCVIAWTWVYFTGIIGLLLMILHWSLFNGWCFLSYIEQYLHIRMIGKSRYDLPPYTSSLFYKLTKLKL